MSLAPLTQPDPQILIVDDDAGLASGIRDYLAQNGFGVRIAADAAGSTEP